MQQRRYHGHVSPAELAGYLADHYAARPNMQIQWLGQDDSWVVQIGAAGQPWGHPAGDDSRAGTSPRCGATATTIGLHRVADDEILVTVAAQGAISPGLAGYLVLMGVISLVAWPLAIFVLVWLTAALVSGRAQRTDIWTQIEIYTMSRGVLPGRPVRWADLPGHTMGAVSTQIFAQPAPLALLPGAADATTRKLPIHR